MQQGTEPRSQAKETESLFNASSDVSFPTLHVGNAERMWKLHDAYFILKGKRENGAQLTVG